MKLWRLVRHWYFPKSIDSLSVWPSRALRDFTGRCRTRFGCVASRRNVPRSLLPIQLAESSTSLPVPLVGSPSRSTSMFSCHAACAGQESLTLEREQSKQSIVKCIEVFVA